VFVYLFVFISIYLSI